MDKPQNEDIIFQTSSSSEGILPENILLLAFSLPFFIFGLMALLLIGINAGQPIGYILGIIFIGIGLLALQTVFAKFIPKRTIIKLTKTNLILEQNGKAKEYPWVEILKDISVSQGLDRRKVILLKHIKTTNSFRSLWNISFSPDADYLKLVSALKTILRMDSTTANKSQLISTSTQLNQELKILTNSDNIQFISESKLTYPLISYLLFVLVGSVFMLVGCFVTWGVVTDDSFSLFSLVVFPVLIFGSFGILGLVINFVTIRSLLNKYIILATDKALYYAKPGQLRIIHWQEFLPGVNFKQTNLGKGTIKLHASLIDYKRDLVPEPIHLSIPEKSDEIARRIKELIKVNKA